MASQVSTAGSSSARYIQFFRWGYCTNRPGLRSRRKAVLRAGPPVGLTGGPYRIGAGRLITAGGASSPLRRGRQGGPLLGCRDVGDQVRRVRGADDGGRQARVAEGEAEDELHRGHACVGEQVLDARGLPVPLAEARLLGERAGPPVLVLRRRATGRAASDQRSRALVRRLGDEVLMVALDSRVGDLEGVEDVHCEVVGQVRKDA